MRNLIIILLLILFSKPLFSQVNPNNHYVNGYTRSDGTRVKGHYRTNSNSTNTDNYSTKPNVNPYTGKKGYINPDNNYIPSTSYNNSTLNYNSYIPSTADLPSYNYTNTSSNFNSTNNYSSSTMDYDKIKREQEKWMREEYPKVQAEQERWMREEYPKIQAEQQKYLRNYNSNYSTRTILLNTYSENPTSLAIKYHNRYNLKDKKIIEIALQKLGYNIGIAEGYIDSSTINGIKQFQRNANVKVDGKVGSRTLQVLSQQFE
jgi:hypothetical protein